MSFSAMPAALRPSLQPPDPAAFPCMSEPLEEVGAAEPADAAAALAFAFDRLSRLDDPRPLIVVTTPLWVRERGRPFAQGLDRRDCAPDRLIWVRAEREVAALWALEEALKSGAVAGGLATVEQPAFVVTRRLDFAARAGAAKGVLLRAGPALDLSAARRRWRISGQPSGEAAAHAAAPGPARLTAGLVRRRDGPPGVWELEWSHETDHFSVVARLADHGLDDARAPRPQGAQPKPAQLRSAGNGRRHAA